MLKCNVTKLASMHYLVVETYQSLLYLTISAICLLLAFYQSLQISVVYHHFYIFQPLHSAIFLFLASV